MATVDQIDCLRQEKNEMKTALNRVEARKILVQDSSQTSESGQTDVETLYEEERDRNKVCS